MVRGCLLLLPVIVLLAYLATQHHAEACNEAVCASLVSKCILLKSCGCEVLDKGNCTCCRNCTICLSKLYVQCCSCVGICPKPKLENSIYSSSTIEDLPHALPELFNVLTEQDEFMQWTTYRYPTYHTLLQYRPELGHFAIDLGAEPDLVDASSRRHIFQAEALKNCTVAYLHECMSLSKCKASCKSMGAAKMRWFNDDGCCQCIGTNCLDYGMNESKCKYCTPSIDNDGDKVEPIPADERPRKKWKSASPALDLEDGEGDLYMDVYD